MKKSYLIMAAIASVALVSCSNEEFMGDPQNSPEGGGAISFNLMTPAITRGEKTGKAAATDLGNQFIIWGEKNETSGDAATATNLVFKNYKVQWTDNSAYTTTSNTMNWEYVGLTPYTGEQVSPAISGTQSIKYWDYNANSYTFTAISALSTDILSGYVKITKITSGSTVYDKGYEIAVNNGASLGNIFVADRNNIAKTTGTDRTASNAYGGNVKMTFRNFNSKIRFGLYENIHGYKVNITNVEYNSTGSATTKKFGVDGKFLAIGDGTNTNTVFTVKYDANNKAIVTVKTGGDPAITPGTADYLETAQSVAESPILSSTAATPISTTSASPTWDKTDGAYTMVLPYPSNTTSMKVKLDFTLTSEDTGEEISVVDATAEIPASYCQWQSNYAYTYLLKINDNTNGQIGNVTGLYPITFDAVVITDQNTGDAEYITTVSEPSITTFGVNSATGKYVTDGSEYAAGSDIYATFMEGSTVKTPTLSGSGAQHVNVFKVTSSDETKFPITEASVAEAIANPARITNAVYTCAVTDVTSKAANELTNEGTYYKKDANNKAPGDAGYVPTPAVKNTDYTIGASENTIADGVNIYTCTVTYTAVASAAALATGTTYYKTDSGSKAPGATGYEPTIAVAGTDYQVAPEITATNINDDASTNFTAVPAVATSVPGEDGKDITIAVEVAANSVNNATGYYMDKGCTEAATLSDSYLAAGTYYKKFTDALKLTGVKAGTYAIEYEASAAWTGEFKKVYKVIKVQ